MAIPVFFRFMNAVVLGDLPLLKEAEAEAASGGVDLRHVTRGYQGRSLLHLAVEGSCVTGRLDVCRYLVEEKGFDASSTSSEGETPIFIATKTEYGSKAHGFPGVVPLLNYFLGRGVDPAEPDAKGCTPLHNAAEFGHNEAMVLLLSRGIPVDPVNHHGTPLHLAAASGNAQALKILLDHGADPNKVVNRVFSPLLMACAGGSLECVKLLVEAGADVNFQHSLAGPTALLAAASMSSAKMVNFLLEAGADPNVHDGYGKFPIMQAAFLNRHELVQILLPRTNPIPSLPDWSVDGVIAAMKTLPRELFVEPIAKAKSEGKEAFANGDYAHAITCFARARSNDLHDDGTLLANMSLCWLKLREGKRAILDARECQRLRPRWAKAWYREGEALSFLGKHGAAITAFQEALKRDPANVEIKNKLREAMETLNTTELHISSHGAW